MPWVQLDDQIANHPKILKAGPEAAWLWTCAIAYCQNHLTDGYVPVAALTTMGAFKAPRTLAERLVEARKTLDGPGLFERRGEDYAVHDYLEHQPSKAVVLERRAKAAARKARERERKGHADVAPGQWCDKDSDTTQDGHQDNGHVTPGHPRDSRASRVPTPTPTPQEHKPVKDPPAVADRPGDAAEGSDTRRFLKEFERLYAQHRQGAAYFVKWPEYAPIVKRLLKLHAYDRLVKHAKILLTTNESWIAETDRGVPILASKINWLEERLTAWEAKQRGTA